MVELLTNSQRHLEIDLRVRQFELVSVSLACRANLEREHPEVKDTMYGASLQTWVRIRDLVD